MRRQDLNRSRATGADAGAGAPRLPNSRRFIMRPSVQSRSIRTFRADGTIIGTVSPIRRRAASI